MRRHYTTVKIPTDLAKKLDRAVENEGYTSRAEIVNDAIRRFIELHQKNLTMKLADIEAPLLEAK